VRTTGRGLEWLFAAPWRLVALVAIVVALPILALGELSANDAHERIRAAELDALAIAARRAAASLDDRVQTIAGQVSAGSATPVSGRPTPLLLALERNDPTALDSFASYLQAVLGDQVERVVVLDRAGHIVAAAPAPPRPGADYAGRDLFTQVSAASPTFISGIYLTEGAAGGVLTGSTDTPVVGVSVLVRDLGGARAGVVVAEVGLPLLGTALTPLLGAADDVYLIDSDGRLVLRATHAFTPDAAFGRDLRGSATATAALGGASQIAADDPLGGGARLVGISPASTRGWRVLAVRSPAALEAELDGSLAEQRAIRLGLIALLLAGAVLLGRTGSRALRQRSALAAALGEVQAKDRTLEVANAQLREATAAKSRFLANMSHELRTPLNAIIGFSDVLEQRLFGELNDKQADYTRDIATSGRHLLDLVNEILDLSKVEAGRMELDRSEFALADTIRAALAFVRERAAGHRIELTAQLPEDLGTVVADERKVRQVLLNLLSNAVKFTPDGGRVAVRAQRMNDEIQIGVQDTGIGIAPEDQLRVFEEFHQVGKTSDRSREGTGLGLTLAKRFIELHGGRIWIDSEVGKGTTLTFALPLGRTAIPN
jgi:signal transduction histidine kinase